MGYGVSWGAVASRWTGKQKGPAGPQGYCRGPHRVEIDGIHDAHLVVGANEGAEGIAGGVGSKDLDLCTLGIKHGASVSHGHQQSGLDFGRPE